ncbi:heavy metal-associated domain-containing protein [Proteiniphilum sp.]|nr:heavy metal-associated domain-containing protein [Proteiniphilum sp.]MEA4918000.1 heavy metal-associated domain-containing protein [Proteiniphilum sp.]
MKKYVLSVVVVATLSFAACNSGSKSETATSQTEVKASAQQDQHASLAVQGLCEMCKENIEKAAKSVDGVSMAEWNAEKKELHLHFDAQKTSLDAVSKAIAKVGYDTDKDKADQATYDALPACCKYRG